MNVFNEIKSNKADKLKETFIPILSLNRVNINETFDSNISTLEIFDFLNCSLPFKVLLSTQYFYDKVCGENNGIHSNTFTDNAIDAKILSILKKLFIKVKIDMASVNNSNKKLWLVTVNGISAEGKRIIENLEIENHFDSIIQELYITAKLPTSKDNVGLYEIISDGNLPHSENENLDSLIKNNLFRCMDVSALTLEQCANNYLINYIIQHKEKVYLSVNEYPTKDKCFKILYWC